MSNAFMLAAKNNSHDSDTEDEDSYDPLSHTEDVPFETDVYMLLMLRLLRFWNRHAEDNDVPTCELVAKLALAAVLYMFNVVIQVLVMVFVFEVSYSQLDSTFNQQAFLRDHNMSMSDASHVLRQAVESGTPGILLPSLNMTVAVDDHSGILSKCEQQHKVPFVAIYYVMLFLWTSFMLKEFKFIRVMMTALWHAQTRDGNRGPIFDGNVVIQLNGWMRTVLFLVCPVAKLMTAVPLTYAGCKFLILQTAPMAIVMKVLALQLVINTDELLVAGLSTRVCSGEVAAARLRAQMREMKRLIHWDSGIGGLFYIVTAVIVVLLVTDCFYGDLMDFRRSCNLYYRTFNPPASTGRLLLDLGGLEGDL